jgi:hypothetical protein
MWLSLSVHASPFIRLRGACTGCGAPKSGPGLIAFICIFSRALIPSGAESFLSDFRARPFFPRFLCGSFGGDLAFTVPLVLVGGTPIRGPHRAVIRSYCSTPLCGAFLQQRLSLLRPVMMACRPCARCLGNWRFTMRSPSPVRRVVRVSRGHPRFPLAERASPTRI